MPDGGGSIDLHVLGAGPAYTDRAGAIGSAYLIRHGDDAILLDLGQGAFPSLARAIEPSRLRGIVVSHLHPDHFVDLVALRHYLRYELRPPRRVSVWGPAGLDRRLDALHDEPGFTVASLDVFPLAVGEVTLGPFIVEAALVTHATESYAFRVALADRVGRGVEGWVGGGPRPGLVYSGDCGEADDLRALIRPGDILLTEVSFGPGPVPAGALHLDGPAVGALAAATGAGRVLLTHLQMGFDEVATVASVRAAGYDGPVELVAPGDRFAI